MEISPFLQLWWFSHLSFILNEMFENWLTSFLLFLFWAHCYPIWCSQSQVGQAWLLKDHRLIIGWFEILELVFNLWTNCSLNASYIYTYIKMSLIFNYSKCCKSWLRWKNAFRRFLTSIRGFLVHQEYDTKTPGNRLKTK